MQKKISARSYYFFIHQHSSRCSLGIVLSFLYQSATTQQCLYFARDKLRKPQTDLKDL